MTKFLTSERRKWIYNIAIAVLVILAGYGFIDSTETDNYTRLIEAILNIGGVVAVSVARANITPDESENQGEDLGKHGVE